MHNPFFTSAQFKNLYLQLGLGNNSTGNLAALHKVCPNAKTCWNANEIPTLVDGSPDEREWTTISHPWIGDKFQESKLLCLGVNMNHHGGFSACCALVKDACAEMLEREKKEFVLEILTRNMPGLYSSIVWVFILRLLRRQGV